MFLNCQKARRTRRVYVWVCSYVGSCVSASTSFCASLVLQADWCSGTSKTCRQSWNSWAPLLFPLQLKECAKPKPLCSDLCCVAVGVVTGLVVVLLLLLRRRLCTMTCSVFVHHEWSKSNHSFSYFTLWYLYDFVFPHFSAANKNFLLNTWKPCESLLAVNCEIRTGLDWTADVQG